MLLDITSSFHFIHQVKRNKKKFLTSNVSYNNVTNNTASVVKRNTKKEPLLNYCSQQKIQKNTIRNERLLKRYGPSIWRSRGNWVAVRGRGKTFKAFAHAKGKIAWKTGSSTSAPSRGRLINCGRLESSEQAVVDFETYEALRQERKMIEHPKDDADGRSLMMMRRLTRAVRKRM